MVDIKVVYLFALSLKQLCNELGGQLNEGKRHNILAKAFTNVCGSVSLSAHNVKMFILPIRFVLFQNQQYITINVVHLPSVFHGPSSPAILCAKTS